MTPLNLFQHLQNNRRKKVLHDREIVRQGKIMRAEPLIRRYAQARKILGYIPARIIWKDGWFWVNNRRIDEHTFIQQTLKLEAFQHERELGGENV